MVSVFFDCSSPYIGYTLKHADYIKKEMKSVSEKDMTAIGYKLFNSSGSFMTLGNFDGRKYFHTRQSQSENFDEQGRRIYTNVAFVGENSKDDKTIDKIAMYVMFNENTFYKQIADMITLQDDGFTIEFDKLNSFVDKLNKTNISIKSSSHKAVKFYDDIMSCNNKELSFVITESTWSYFTKQAGYDFNESVLYKLSLQDAEILTVGSTVEFSDEASKKDDSITPPPAPPVEKKVEEVVPENIPANEAKIKVKADESKLSDEKDKEIQKLKQDINNICAERNSLETEVNKLKAKISGLLKENAALKDEQKKLTIKGILKGVIGTVLAVLVILILKWIF